MSDSNRTRVLSRALAKGLGMTVYMGPTMDEEGPVALIVADDAHAARIADARKNAAPKQRSLLVTGNARRSGADIFLDHDADAGTVANAIDGLRAYRAHELAIPADAEIGLGATQSLEAGEFSIQTREQASDVAILLGRATPRPCATAVGLYVLLANAIEHGNLGFDATEKAKGLAEGNWERKLAKRMTESEYEDRRVHLRFQRGGRILSFIIQDDGEGIDAETAEMADPSRAGYRGKGIKLAKSMGFGQVNYLGIGNTVEATVLLPQRLESSAAPRAAMAR
ncbi:ATP-binding protein [uncultured Maricaulis sp.]|uniref:ATP-binding protein n=1 Tax=uncultured Maricaulis sp. TaxID=174710 RepID=UPI002614F49B|nr:ATP-binding protein [uncultured Maricaulis sp.]